MSTIFDLIRKDAEAGTPGPWAVGDRPVFGNYYGRSDPKDWNGMGHLALFSVTAGPSHAGPNARRIARVPQLERIALAAEEQLLPFANHMRSCDLMSAFIDDKVCTCGFSSALDAFREATK